MWGDTVNTASRRGSHGEPGLAQLGPRAARRLSRDFRIEDREKTKVRGKGWITPARLVGRRAG